MRAFGIWILSVIMVYALGFAIAEDFGRLLGFCYAFISGIGYVIFRFTRKKKTKFTSTKIALGKGTGFLIPTETKAPV